MFKRATQEYVYKKHCRHCGYDKFYVDRERVSRRPCSCSGLHYPHRPGTRYCEKNPYHNAQRAMRSGCPPDVVMDLFAEAAWEAKGKRHGLEDCPF